MGNQGFHPKIFHKYLNYDFDRKFLQIKRKEAKPEEVQKKEHMQANSSENHKNQQKFKPCASFVLSFRIFCSIFCLMTKIFPNIFECKIEGTF